MEKETQAAPLKHWLSTGNTLGTIHIPMKRQSEKEKEKTEEHKIISSHILPSWNCIFMATNREKLCRLQNEKQINWGGIAFQGGSLSHCVQVTVVKWNWETDREWLRERACSSACSSQQLFHIFLEAIRKRPQRRIWSTCEGTTEGQDRDRNEWKRRGEKGPS